MSQKSLAALAILKVNWDRDHHDYLECFVPLVADSVRTLIHDAVSLPELQKEVRARFAIDIPQHALRTLLNRLAKYHFVNARDGIFYRDVEHCNALTFSALQQDMERIYDETIVCLINFVQQRFQTTWATEHAERAFVDFLRNDDERVLLAVFERENIQAAPGGAATERFIVGAFVAHTQSDEPTTFDHIATVAKGHVLATALFVADPSTFQENFKGTRVFFDTPFLLAYLGYAGSERQIPSEEVVELLTGAKADLACFQATINEVQGILEACAHNLHGSRLAHSSSEVNEYFIGRGMTESDVLLAAARVPEKLQAKGFELVDFPHHDPEHQIVDERALEKVLRTDVGYRDDRPLTHDVMCASAIGHLRQGHLSKDLERSRALFVTPNVALARCVRAHDKQGGNPGSAPLFVTDFMLGNLLWLKNPTRAPDLPAKRLIADAYASMQPSEDLWKRYLTELTRLRKAKNVKEGDYLLLRHSVSAKRALMDLTQGDAHAFSEGTVPDVLTVAREHVRADLVAQLDQERLGRGNEQRDAAKREGDLLGQLGIRDGRVFDLEGQMAREERRSHARLERTAARAWRIAVAATTIPRWVAAVGLTLVAFYPSAGGGGSPSHSPFDLGSRILGLVLAGLSAWSLFTGGSIQLTFRRWHIGMARWMLDEWWDLNPSEVAEALTSHLRAIGVRDRTEN